MQVTASEVLPLGLEIGVKNGKIACIGVALPQGQETKVIDAQGGYVTPGGVDSHVHLAQLNCPEGTLKFGPQEPNFLTLLQEIIGRPARVVQLPEALLLS